MADTLILTEKLLDSLLAKPLLELGFKRTQRLIFQKETPGLKQLLRFPARLQNGVMFFNANGAIRFEKIEGLLGNADPLSPTLMMPVHLLRPSKEHLEWQFLPESSRGLIEQVLADCRQYLLPFLETMSVVESLKSQLLYEIDYYSNADGRQKAERLRLVLSPEQRIEKLAAIYVLEGKKDAAEHLVDSELAKLVGKQLPPQIAQRIRWERFKKVVLASSVD